MTDATPTLSAAQARRLADAEVAVGKLEAQLEIAKATRQELRTRYLPRIPLSSDPKERAAGTRTCTVGGVIIRVTPRPGGEYFSLKAYRDAGHAITAAMREAMSLGKASERWTVKPASGPKSVGAVDPS